MINIKSIIEKQGFGVCHYLGNKMGIQISRVRLYFIYLSFGALGSPIVIYLFVAFWLNIRSYIRKGYNAVLN
jgi:phage shock protein PspC (stress-responsive transcriptional regulator)